MKIKIKSKDNNNNNNLKRIIRQIKQIQAEFILNKMLI